MRHASARPAITSFALAALTAAAMLASNSSAATLLGPDSLHVGGFVSTSYNVATHALDDRIVGRLYGGAQDQFTLNAFELGLDRAAATGMRDAGFTVRALFGTDATYIKARGLDLGPQADLVQANLVLNLPAGHGDVQFTLGKMTSLLGVEVIESVANPNLSVGSQFIFLMDFTNTGLDVNWLPGGRWTARARVTNGWDVVDDNNRARSVEGRIGFAPDAKTSLALLGYTGAETTDNGRDLRKGGEFIATRDHGAGLFQIELDYGRDDGVDATWWGAGAWETLHLGGSADLSLRADVVDDTDGARTGGALGFPATSGQQLTSGTVTLNLREWPRALVRPEVRYDHSTQPSFAGNSDQWTFALGAAFMF